MRLTERGATGLRDKARAPEDRGARRASWASLFWQRIGTAGAAQRDRAPLAYITQVARSIGAGDLTLHISTDRQDEMGEAARA